MIMSPGVRKVVLTTHVATSVGLLGSIAAFLALATVAITTSDDVGLRAAYVAMNIVARIVILPLALAALLSGVVQALGTSWGLLRHYWVVFKLLITSFATAILLIKMTLIAEGARLAAQTVLPRNELGAFGPQLVVHASVGLLVLIIPLILSIYKPQGKTPYGWRKQQTHQAETL